jgi:hypothetical protein
MVYDTSMLSGDMAHTIYMSDNRRPLEDFLDAWRFGEFSCHPGYVVSVINSYGKMVEQGKDGRYGKIR